MAKKKKVRKSPEEERREITLFCRKFHNICIEKKLYLRNDYTRLDFAREMDTNHVYLSRKLKIGSKLNLKEFIWAIRMTVAYKLLKSTNYDITKIMANCGYHDKSSFYRAFHKRFHCSPTDIRKRFFANA